MGGQQSKKRDQMVDIIKGYPYNQKNAISQQEFVQEVFLCLDLDPHHTSVGPIFVAGSHIIRLYYHHLFAANKGGITKGAVVDAIKELYEQPQSAIEYSYRIIQPNLNASITKTQFVNFVMTCFDQGIQAILKRSKYETQFKQSFKEWTNKNRVKMVASTEQMFQNNVQSQGEIWTRGDFKRWICSKNNWTIHVEISGQIHKIPLNIPCLFGIILEEKK